MRAAEGVGQSEFLHRTTGCQYIRVHLRGKIFWLRPRTERKVLKDTASTNPERSKAVGTRKRLWKREVDFQAAAGRVLRP